jgi:hypothetical protein
MRASRPGTSAVVALVAIGVAVAGVVVLTADDTPPLAVDDRPEDPDPADDDPADGPDDADPSSPALDPAEPVTIAEAFRPDAGDTFADSGVTVVDRVEDLPATDLAELPTGVNGVTAPEVDQDDPDVSTDVTTATLRPERADDPLTTGSAPPLVGGLWLADGRLVAGDLFDPRGDALLVEPADAPDAATTVTGAGVPLDYGTGSDPQPDRPVGVHATTGELLVVPDDDPLQLVARDLDTGSTRELATVTEPPHGGVASTPEFEVEPERRVIAAAHAVGDTVVVVSSERPGAEVFPSQNATGSVPAWMHLGSEGDELDALRPVGTTWPPDDTDDFRVTSVPRLVTTDDGPLVVTAETGLFGPLEVVVTDAAGDTRVAMRLDEIRDDSQDPPAFRYDLDPLRTGPFTSFDVVAGQVLVTGADPLDEVTDDVREQAVTTSFVRGDTEVVGTSLVLDLIDGSVTRLDAFLGPTTTAFAPNAVG